MPHRSSRLFASAVGIAASTKLRFPLPDDYFPSVSLSLSQVQEYQTQVEEMVTEAMESCRDHESRVAGFVMDDEKRWQLVAHDPDLSIVRRKQGPLTTTRTFGTVMGDFRRFIDFFSSETSEQLFAWNQFFFGCAIDAAVLCNLSVDKPIKRGALGIKWTCMQPSILARKRDECFLEYIVFRKDDQGRDVAVIVRLPIEIPECPLLPHELKTKRERIITKIVVRASDVCPNATQVFMLSQCEHKGLTASTKYCKKLLRALKDVSLSADAKRIATALYTRGFMEQSRVGGESIVMGDTIRSQVPSTIIQQNCTSCSRPFRGRHRRRHCQVCGDVFCTKCLLRRAGIRQQKQAFNDDIAMTSRRTFRVARSLVCKSCIGRFREVDVEPTQERYAASLRLPRRSLMVSSTQSNSTTPASSATQCRHAKAPYRSATWSEEDRVSWWSESEYDTCSWKSGSCHFSFSSRNFSGTPTVRSSISSEYSLSSSSFLVVQSLETPRETDADSVGDRTDERSSIYEVIDTKDMLPEKQVQNKQSKSLELTNDFFSKFSSTFWTAAPQYSKATQRACSLDMADKPASSRSLDQCIAEQKELLQQVLSASRGYKREVRTKATFVTEIFPEDDIGSDDYVFAV